MMRPRSPGRRRPHPCPPSAPPSQCQPSTCRKINNSTRQRGKRCETKAAGKAGQNGSIANRAAADAVASPQARRPAELQGNCLDSSVKCPPHRQSGVCPTHRQYLMNVSTIVDACRPWDTGERKGMSRDRIPDAIAGFRHLKQACLVMPEGAHIFAPARRSGPQINGKRVPAGDGAHVQR